MLKKQLRRTNGGPRLPLLITAVAFLLLPTLSGCSEGDGLKRQAVSGTVTCDGKPISAGSILFEPDTYQSGTAVGATVRDGSFSISQRNGPVPGFYKVRIYMSSGIQAPPHKGHTDRSPQPMVEFLPEQYNAKTSLRADVSESRRNRFRFELSSTPSSDSQ
jgi:hypothetical protein